MAEYIECRDCTSPDCKGCNLKNLETMLKIGKFDCLMNGNRCIVVNTDVAPVKHGRCNVCSGKNVLTQDCDNGYSLEIDSEQQELYVLYEDLCLSVFSITYCPNCGARLDGGNDEE